MATPTMIAISGVAETPPGTPDGDFVLEIEQQGYLTHSDGTLIEPTVYRIEAAADGSVSGSVPASTDPAWIYTDPARGIRGTTWSYRVTYWALGTEQRGPFRCTISHLSPGAAITLNDLLPAGTIENTAIYAPVNHTHAGGGGGGAVDSVNGRTGAVVLTKTDVGLSAVDNTSDASKPISTATATALAGKAAAVHTHVQGDVTGLTTSLAGKSDVGHGHTQAEISGLTASLAGKSDTGHTHAATAVSVSTTGFGVLSPAATTAQAAFIEADAALLKARSTGVQYGGALTNLGGGQVRIAAGVGGILTITDPSAPVYNAVSWTQTDLNLSGADGVYYVYVTTAGAVLTTLTVPDEANSRDRMYLWRVSIRSGLVSGTGSIVTPLQHYGQQIRDLFEAVGPLKRGLALSSVAANLTFAISSGNAYIHGVNFYNAPKTPHRISVSALSPVTFRHVDQQGDQTTDRTALDVGNYDVAGTITAVPGATTRATIFTVYFFPGSGNVRVFYGQSWYATVADAQTALQSGNYNPVVPTVYQEDALRLGWIIAQKGATSLADGVQVFISSNIFGGAGGSLSSAGSNALLVVNALSELAGVAATARTNIGAETAGAATAAVSAHVAASDPHTQYARVLTSSGGAYAVSTTAEIYIGPNDPGAVPDGSLWIDTDA